MPRMQTKNLRDDIAIKRIAAIGLEIVETGIKGGNGMAGGRTGDRMIQTGARQQ